MKVIRIYERAPGTGDYPSPKTIEGRTVVGVWPGVDFKTGNERRFIEVVFRDD